MVATKRRRGKPFALVQIGALLPNGVRQGEGKAVKARKRPLVSRLGEALVVVADTR